MEPLIRAASLLFGGIMIAVSGSMLVNIAEKIMKQFKLSELSVGFLLLSVSTSSPELSVAIISALENKASISIGDILGSNVTNITLIVGLALIVAGEVILNEQNIIELADVLFFCYNDTFLYFYRWLGNAVYRYFSIDSLPALHKNRFK